MRTDSAQIRNGPLDQAALLLRTTRCDSVGLVPSTFSSALRMALSKLQSVATCLLSTLTNQRSPLPQRIRISSRSSANHRQIEASSALAVKAAAALT
jgi:hypothetical protein